MSFRWFVCAAIVAALLPAYLAAQPRFGVGVSAGTLGIGPQAAISITRLSNIRGGANFFSYNDSFTKDGVHYDGALKFRSIQLTWDQYFPHLGGFHISPGALLYDGNSGHAAAQVPGGSSFTLGSATYYSSAADPVSGTGDIAFNKAAPMILIGFGNLVPRSNRHFGVNVDLGVVFQGSPNAKLNLAGTACLNAAQTACLNASDPAVQANVLSEQKKINHDLDPFRYYPIVSLALSYRF
ncbi:MAG TPA: hypothetical protein VFT60_06130 [Bryobacteraceae bacterium]|jgi:hypothetical protein|nr:hypothetical protein [Bryobacteraceae bacterium]